MFISYTQYNFVVYSGAGHGKRHDNASRTTRLAAEAGISFLLSVQDGKILHER